ncbi:bifunctional UDP-N-acetylglucosamine diphosphorylase/glucosamine-1-phosphate N-acetyltransferase GlmU [Magnetococcales bacterium HHB-1]
MGLQIIILAAGQGTRMRSKKAKVLHPLAGKPLLAHVLATARALKPERLVVVIGHQAEAVKEAVDAADIHWAVQHQQHGTGHAVRCALPELNDSEGAVLILNGDVPLVQAETLAEFIALHQQAQHKLTLLTTSITPPDGYGRVIRSTDGLLQGVVEEKDASEDERKIAEINSGIYLVDRSSLPGWLAALKSQNAQEEYYLTDIIAMAAKEGGRAGIYHHDDYQALSGINSRHQLAMMERIYRDRLVRFWMARGVTFIDPQSVWLSADVEIGQDTIIEPHVQLGEGVKIGQDCHVGGFCVIKNSQIGDACQILPFTHIEGASLKGDNPVGPFTRLRPLATLESGAKVGNFCEVKKANIGLGSKVNHLTYIGDSQIGAGVNVGAGTITCNYDGKNKHQTIIGDGAFIGSDTQLVAPVEVGAGAVIGAGSTIVKDVPEEALALSRVKQRHVANWKKRKQ